MDAPNTSSRPSGNPHSARSGPDPATTDHTKTADTAADDCTEGAGTAADDHDPTGTAAADDRTAGAASVGWVSQHRVAGRFSPAARTKLQAARLWVALNRPYYCAALFACPLIASKSRPTMTIAMDHQWRIYINPDYVESNTVERVAAVLIHEINHALRSHAERGRRTAPPELDAFWKVACEFEINDDLECDDLDIADGLLPEHFGLEEQDTAELYYRELIEGSVCVGAVPDCGPICTAHPDQRHGDTLDACGVEGDHHPQGLDACGVEGLTVAQRQLAQQATAQAVLQCDPYGGDVPFGLHQWAQHRLTPAVDWRQRLARVLRHSLHTHTGASDYTWQRPSRRQDPADSVIRPAMAAPTASITVVLDTSGSMDQHDHARAFAEINAILTRAVPAQAVRVLAVDQQVNTDQQITQARQITPQGGRGTDMAAGIETAAETRPAAIIVITDGHTPWPRTRPPGARTVIAALTDCYAIHEVPGWIHAIDMSEGPGDDPG